MMHKPCEGSLKEEVEKVVEDTGRYGLSRCLHAKAKGSTIREIEDRQGSKQAESWNIAFS